MWNTILIILSAIASVIGSSIERSKRFISSYRNTDKDAGKPVEAHEEFAKHRKEIEEEIASKDKKEGEQ